MKINLSKLENKYYYAINRYFWHLLIALSLLLIAIGAAVYLWSYVPPKKEQVVKGPKPEKPAYPSLQKVDAYDIIAALPKKKKKIEKPAPETDKNEPAEELQPDYEPLQRTQENKTVDSAAMRAFYESLAYTKELIPIAGNKSFWLNKYEYYFASPRDRKLYRKTKNPAFRKRRLKQKGFDVRFSEYADRQGFKDYDEKNRLLSSLNIMLEAHDSINRKTFANDFLTTFPARRYGLSVIDRRFKAIAQVLKHIPAKEQKAAYRELWNFINSNPNDGMDMVRYMGRIIDKIQKDQRLAFIKQMEREYYGYYNNNLNAFIESTDNFLEMLSQLPADNQAEALRIYYRYYRHNNLERARRIRQIDREYEQAVNKWENDYRNALRRADTRYNAELYKRKNYRSWSLKGIISAFAAILVLTLILLTVSMIRNINRLTEAIYENNRQMNLHMENLATAQTHHPENQDKEEDNG